VAALLCRPSSGYHSPVFTVILTTNFSGGEDACEGARCGLAVPSHQRVRGFTRGVRCEGGHRSADGNAVIWRSSLPLAARPEPRQRGLEAVLGWAFLTRVPAQMLDNTTAAK
jgi:hypothetical protein